MSAAIFSYYKERSFRIFRTACLIILLAVAAGCSANYGRLQADDAVLQNFQNYQPPSGYKYYLYGHSNRYYAIAGINSEFILESRMWRDIDPDSEKFKTAVYWMWDEYFSTNHRIFGAKILDPNGSTAGVYFSAIRFLTVKFGEGNRIELMPDTPFLKGPVAEKENGQFLTGQALKSEYYSQKD